jgi:hypothetical protein
VSLMIVSSRSRPLGVLSIVKCRAVGKGKIP